MLPDELKRREDRLKAIVEAKAQSNFTDPQSRIMKTSSESFQQCYNAQLAVEGGNQLIVAAEVTSNASDQGRCCHVLPRFRRITGPVRRRC